MDLERCSVSSSDSSSADADQMELEAAEALADLAHLAMRETSSGGGGVGVGGGGEWGSKGKRVMKRVKSESPPVSNSVSDLALDVDLPKLSASCSRSYPSYACGRSRLNLTEEEKEERRLRRILANRESARQTIRRRQALCEELTRKAADLSWENENLKREKELALKKFQSLDTTNKHLKAQMAKLIKDEVEESPRELKSAFVDMPTACPLFLYNQHAFSPHCWPSIIQSSSPVQSHHRPQNAIVIPSKILMPSSGTHTSQQQQENQLVVSGPSTPLYIVSCPWFFQVPDHGNGLHPRHSVGFKHKQDGTSMSDLCCGSSFSKAGEHMENQYSSISMKVELETASSAEVSVINDLNETPVGFTLDGGGQSAGPCPKESILTPVPPSSVTPTIAAKIEPESKSECAFNANGIRMKDSQLMSALPEKNHSAFKFPSKKPLDAALAAAARRRRKELTKLKNLHGRQCRMNC